MGAEYLLTIIAPEYVCVIHLPVKGVHRPEIVPIAVDDPYLLRVGNHRTSVAYEGNLLAIG